MRSLLLALLSLLAFATADATALRPNHTGSRLFFGEESSFGDVGAPEAGGGGCGGGFTPVLDDLVFWMGVDESESWASAGTPYVFAYRDLSGFEYACPAGAYAGQTCESALVMDSGPTSTGGVGPGTDLNGTEPFVLQNNGGRLQAIPVGTSPDVMSVVVDATTTQIYPAQAVTIQYLVRISTTSDGFAMHVGAFGATGPNINTWTPPDLRIAGGSQPLLGQSDNAYHLITLSARLDPPSPYVMVCAYVDDEVAARGCTQSGHTTGTNALLLGRNAAADVGKGNQVIAVLAYARELDQADRVENFDRLVDHYGAW
jgi:hypothetical protein